MTNKEIEKQIEEILSTDPVVKEYQEKKKNDSLTFFDKVLYVKYLAMKTTELYSMFHN